MTSAARPAPVAVRSTSQGPAKSMGARLECIIAGAGSAGLCAAVCLAREGHSVTVFERRPELGTGGGGLALRSGAVLVLEHYGMTASLNKMADLTRGALWVDGTNNQVLRRFSHRTVEYGIYRREMQKLLYKEAEQSGVKFRFGAALVDVVDEAGSKPTATTEQGEKVSADLIIVADGTRSRLRAKVLPDVRPPIEPNIAPSCLYLVRIPVEQMKANEEARKLIATDDLSVHIGRGVYVVSRYSKCTNTWSGLCGVPDPLKPDQPLWQPDGDLNKMNKQLEGCSAALRNAFALADKCERWQLADLPPLPRWRSTEGRVILLGDAAHAMQPNAAQGLSTSIESCGVIAHVLRNAKSARDIPKLTAVWELARKQRTENIAAFAKWNTEVYTHFNPKKGTAKLKKLPTEPADIPPDPTADYRSLAYSRWLYEYDALKEVDKLLETEVQVDAKL